MAYGTDQGVKDNLLEYADILTHTEVTAEMVTRMIARADGVIDKRLAPIVGAANLPLSSPPQIVRSISEAFATCYVLNSLYTQKDPNDSEWVNKFCEWGQKNLDELVDEPEILGTDLINADAAVESSTENFDEKCYIDQTDGGSPTDTAERGEDSMSKWNDLGWPNG